VEKEWGVMYQSWDDFRKNKDKLMYIRLGLVNGNIEDLEKKVKVW
jgi:hypothetical protein